MTSSSQSCPQALAPKGRLTITEAPAARASDPRPALVGNRIYLYIALGALLGVLLAVGIAYAPRFHSWPVWKVDAVHAKTIAARDVSHETKSLSAAANTQPEASPQN